MLPQPARRRGCPVSHARPPRTVLLPQSVSPPPNIPILELTPPHPVKNNSSHFMCLREPILQPLCFQIHAWNGEGYMGTVPSMFGCSGPKLHRHCGVGSLAADSSDPCFKSSRCNTYKKPGVPSFKPNAPFASRMVLR